MSLWGTVSTKIKEIVNKMIGKKTIEQELHITPAISNRMMEAIDLWTELYEGRAPWLHIPSDVNPLSVRSLGLPQFIASEKARIALLEFKSEITTPTKDAEPVTPNYVNPENIGTDGKPAPITSTHVVADVEFDGSTERADYLNLQYSVLKRDLQTQIEYGIAKGGLIIKPYVVKHDTPANTNVNANTNILTGGEIPKSNYEICFDYVQANEFFPLSFTGSGKMTEAAFIERKFDKDIVYTRLEYHKLEDTTVTVINKAYKSNTSSYNATDLGQPVSLSVVPEWSNLEEETKIENVNRLMFAYFKMPEANTIDSHSPLGVSGFDKAIDLIKDADEQYSRMLWEFEGGELAIDIDRNALRFVEDPNDPNHDGHSVMSRGQQRLYRKVDLNEENTYNVFSPDLRDASIINGLNTILTKIEDKCGLSRGSIANIVSNEAKTATELKIIKQRSYQTNARIQTAIEDALKDTIYVMNALCDLYNITPEGKYDVSFEWDDSIITDKNIELQNRILCIQNGIDSKLETRMWMHGETRQQAVAALKIVQQENIQAVEDNIANMQLMGETPDSKKKESPKDEEGNNDFKSGDNQYSEAK